MAVAGLMAAGMGGDATKWGEIAVKGLDSLLGGLNSLINPKFEVPPFNGTTSADASKIALSAIMAQQNTNLAYVSQMAKNAGLTTAEKAEIEAEIKIALAAKKQCLETHSRKSSKAQVTVGEKPSEEDIAEMHKMSCKIIAAENTQARLLRLYKKSLDSSEIAGESYAVALASNQELRISFVGLLKKIAKGVGKIFGYVEKAKKVYDIVVPYIEKL